MDIRGVRSEEQYKLQAERFLAGRGGVGLGAAAALDRARRQHAAMLNQSDFSAAWQPVGPMQIGSVAYGNVTGRVTSVAIDPADASGNTVYLGTTGGGVWKSTNAAGPVAEVQFVPLTDTLAVFSPNAGGSAMPSLSIGAISVANGVILAGTGDPNDALDSYYGSGILRSADGGVTWTLAQQSEDGIYGNHSFLGLGTAGFAWSTTDASIVVAAMSSSEEGDLVGAAAVDSSVRGLYVSTDAGMTWQMAVIEDGSQTVQTPLPGAENAGGNAATAVVWNAVRQRFYAAVRFHGYYESPDGSVWTRLATQPGTAMTATACPPNANLPGSAGCPIFRGVLAVEPVTGDMYAFSVDSANVDQGLWRDVCGQANGSVTGCASAEPGFAQRLDTTGLEQRGGSAMILQGDYDLALGAVASGAETVVYAGTVDLYRCTFQSSSGSSSGGASGCEFRNTTNTVNGCAAPAMVAPAQHAIATLATGGAPLLYLGNDGGLWRSTDDVAEQGSPCSADDANHFQNLNGGLGSLAEVVQFSQHPTDANTLLTGMGANGTAATSAAGTNSVWPQVSAGEGGYTAIDPAAPMNWYLSTGAGVSILYCGKGSLCGPADFSGTAAEVPTIGPTQVDEDASLIDAPWILDPTASAEVVIGTCRVWRGPAADGSAWSAANQLSGHLDGQTGSGEGGSCDATSAVIRSLATGGPVNGAATSAAANLGSEVLYAGMAGAFDGGGDLGGHVFATSAGNTATAATVWTDMALSPVSNVLSGTGTFNPDGFAISSIAVDAHDPTGNTVYVTIMGFEAPRVYGSTDGGAHWTNLSSNLPAAPANSVVVDPNDAHTVYVAMDTGVYATTQISTCPTANCWSVYGTALPNAPVVQLAAAAGMAVGSGASSALGMLRAATYGRGIWEIPLLSAVPAASAAITMAPAALTFAVEAVGTASAAQTITVTNSGNAPLLVSSVTATGDFTETDDCAGASTGAGQIAAGASCTVQVAFLATATGERAGVLTVYANVPGGQATAALTGAGASPAAIVLNPLGLNFGTVTVGATAAAQNITVSNTGGVTATLDTPSITGDFQISANTCGAMLEAGTGCTLSITFTPAAAGTREGSISVADSAGTQVASLRGVGAAGANDTLSPLALSFAPQQVGTLSAAQTVTLTNAGDEALTLITAQIASGDFSVVNGCGDSLAGHATCALQVQFAPKQVGANTGVLTVSDQFRSQIVALSGAGLAGQGATLSPSAGLTFAATGVGLSSAPQTITLSNQGGVALSLGGISASGDFAVSANGNTCGASVAAGAACSFAVVFTPTAGGARTGSVAVTDNAPGSPQMLPLMGSGVDFTLAANGAASVTVTSGQSAVYPLLLSSAAGVPGAATLSCMGAPANATCLVVPTSVPLGGTTTVSVTVETGVSPAIAGLGQEVMLPVEWAIVLPMFPAAGLFRRRLRGAHGRGRIVRVGIWAMVLVGLCLASGCGSGRTIPPDGLTGSGGASASTPAGTYSIVVSATSAGLTRTVALTLVVR